jgi:hypothetical protein
MLIAKLYSVFVVGRLSSFIALFLAFSALRQLGYTVLRVLVLSLHMHLHVALEVGQLLEAPLTRARERIFPRVRSVSAS